MKQDLVSVITPAWQAGGFITETIESVRVQDYGCWEMLVVDDCSSDNTISVVESVAAVDSRIRLIRQPQNKGPASARNAGLERAKGRYIAFLDSDDLWLRGKLALQVEFMKQCGAAFSYTAFRRFPQDGGSAGSLIKVPSSLTYKQLLGNTAIATSTVMIDRSVTGDFRMKQTYYDDFAAWLELLKRGHCALGIQRDLMRYRLVGRSVSRNKARSARMVWRVYRDVENLGPLESAWHFMRYAVRGLYKYRHL